MKMDLYYIYRRLQLVNLGYPIVLDVLKVWAEKADWEVRVSVCKEGQVDLATDADVVGFSVYTQTAPVVYRLSDELRRKGKVVILGGPHFRGPSTYAEAVPHCDAVVASICEAQWRRLLTDIAREKIASNRRRPIVLVDTKNEFRYPDEFYETFENQKWYQIPSVPTSIGCPFDCNFCSPYLPGNYILRDIRTITKEVARIKRKMIFLCDASFGLNKQFAVDLMSALAPLEKKIMVETPLVRLRDQNFLEALALGGVKWIIVGIETLSLKLTKHGQAEVEESLKRIIDRSQELGIVIQGSLICGLDCDGPESFDHIYRFYSESKIPSIMFDILTPYPNTGLYDRLQREGRILDTNWEHYDYRHVVYQPRRMTIDQLVDGFVQLNKSISDGKSVFSGAWRVFKKHGINAESSAIVAYDLYNRFDAKSKEKTLRSDQIRLRPHGEPGNLYEFVSS
jgi:radical SAM superfamily enzyme YgiQ (UPF0313 family)